MESKQPYFICSSRPDRCGPSGCVGSSIILSPCWQASAGLARVCTPHPLPTHVSVLISLLIHGRLLTRFSSEDVPTHYLKLWVSSQRHTRTGSGTLERVILAMDRNRDTLRHRTRRHSVWSSTSRLRYPSFTIYLAVLILRVHRKLGSGSKPSGAEDAAQVRSYPHNAPCEDWRVACPRVDIDLSNSSARRAGINGSAPHGSHHGQPRELVHSKKRIALAPGRHRMQGRRRALRETSKDVAGLMLVARPAYGGETCSAGIEPAWIELIARWHDEDSPGVSTLGEHVQFPDLPLLVTSSDTGTTSFASAT